MAKPTILLIPGSFCPSALFYDPVVDRLFAAGYDAIPIELLTCTAPSTAKAATMEDDAARIHGVAEKLLDLGKDVVIVMNSYGGLPGTQACEGLSKKEREAAGKPGAVTGLVYLTALLVQDGESLGESMAGDAGLPEYLKVDGEYMFLEPEGNVAVTFSDLPREIGLAYAKKMPGHSAVSFGGKLSTKSHYNIPITYVFCKNDLVVPPKHQQKMIDDIKKVTHSTVDVIELESGHGPHISQPDNVVKAIRESRWGCLNAWRDMSWAS